MGVFVRLREGGARVESDGFARSSRAPRVPNLHTSCIRGEPCEDSAADPKVDGSSSTHEEHFTHINGDAGDSKLSCIEEPLCAGGCHGRHDVNEADHDDDASGDDDAAEGKDESSANSLIGGGHK